VVCTFSFELRRAQDTSTRPVIRYVAQTTAAGWDGQWCDEKSRLLGRVALLLTFSFFLLIFISFSLVVATPVLR
jgi:hypothetical protein